MSKHADKITLLDSAEMQGDLRPSVLAVWQQRYNARRYIFDRSASFRVGEMVRDCIDIMVDNIEFARTPYPTVYFEADARAMWEGWRPDISSDHTADEKVGFLIHEGLVMVLAAGPVYMTSGRGVELVHRKTAALCGMNFRINRPQSVPFSALTGLTESLADKTKQAYVFGGQRMMPPGRPYAADYLDESITVQLPALPSVWSHSQIAAHFDIMPSYSNTTAKDVIKLSFLGGGDPMILTTMLLLLQQPSKFVALEQVGRSVGLWRGKRQVFKEHHVVRLSLGREQKVRDMFHITDRRTPIKHDVSGHWKHYNKSQGCNHHHPDQRQAWEPVGADRTLAGDYKRYWCPYCLQRRTWTEFFTTSGPGVSTHHYEVTR